MYTIGQVAEQTGWSVHTLRYYERIGLVNSPVRKSGVRMYTESDIHFLQFLRSLKNTGMSLEDMMEFTEDGCIRNLLAEPEESLLPRITRRKDILSRHIAKMKEQVEELQTVIQFTEEKLSVYETMLPTKKEESK
ncbi:MerR family transcriptional regulator [Aneurinibacillus soli]|uniref:HTH-type transcriptional regulator AdhR n=1 Tax=Aneurinibacillus soli TaxID=1500254 RepID=A0A0U5B576_9BACL|nr:MerR family transcriptional regulator [Aneurinibacillus soli]PYE60933.1 MerR family transcriptional regulator [Aneurinibacillus soli]BAU26838.1 HTH-type transcriptional regulator AdhR [Aneurinibacillus soli]